MPEWKHRTVKVAIMSRPRDPLAAWSVLVLAAGVVTAGLSVWALVRGWQPAWLNPVTLAGGVLYAAVAVRSLIRQRRYREVRRMLIALVAERHGPEPWLNRDEHLAFGAWQLLWPPARCWSVARLDENLGRELDDVPDGAQVPFTWETFTVMSFAGGVSRADGAGLVVKEAGEELSFAKLPRARSILPVRRVRSWRMSRAGLGTVRVSPDEVRDLICQFRSAEPLGQEEQS